jgi:hypothetical protein
MRGLDARRFLVLVVSLVLLVAACGDAEPELTMAERLAAVEGRELSAAELADRLAVGETLCGMGDEVLDEIWRQLNERQLNYQDVVFGHICPDRSVFYASLTGRYVTEEAEESGVVPSTTRPPITTVAPSSTTAQTDGGETTSSQGPDTATSVDPSDGTATTAATEPSTTTETSAAAETSATTAATTTATITATTVIATTTSSPAEGEGG